MRPNGKATHERSKMRIFWQVIISVARCYGMCVFTEFSTLRSCERLGPARDLRGSSTVCTFCTFGCNFVYL